VFVDVDTIQPGEDFLDVMLTRRQAIEISDTGSTRMSIG
jgi:hypothetical protein